MSVTVVISLHAHNYNTLTHSVSHSHTRRHAAKKIKGEEDEEEEEKKKKKKKGVNPLQKTAPALLLWGRLMQIWWVWPLELRLPLSQMRLKWMEQRQQCVCVRACVCLYGLQHEVRGPPGACWRGPNKNQARTQRLWHVSHKRGSNLTRHNSDTRDFQGHAITLTWIWKRKTSRKTSRDTTKIGK